MIRLKNEFVFQETPTGLLEFVGDFDGLYKEEKDPWGQSGRGSPLDYYYEFSRNRLTALLNRRTRRAVRGPALEVGSGLGYVVDRLNKFVSKLQVEGLDVSSVAVERARSLFPKYQFQQGDIRALDLNLPRRYKVVILNQVLWYVIKQIPRVFENCHDLLLDNGLLVVSQGFLDKPQRYGADVADGVHEFLNHIQLVQWSRRSGELFRLIEFEYDDSNKLPHHDGLLTFRKVRSSS